MKTNKETSKKHERRYRRTETLILGGLTELLQVKSIKEITVRELTQLVDINRSTFYLHYADIYDLLEKTEQRLLDQLKDAVDSKWENREAPHHFYEFLEQTFIILSENAKLCAALVSPNGDIAFLRTIETLFREEGMKALRSFAPAELREQDLQYAISFALAGCLGLVERWLKTGCPDSPTHMAELALLLLREGTSSIGAPMPELHSLHEQVEP